MNEPQVYPTKATIFAYFAHKATPLERQQVESWLTTPEGATLYFTYLDEWERQHPQFQPDLTRAHERFLQFMQQTDQETVSVPFKTEPSPTDPVFTVQAQTWFQAHARLAIAASILLIGSLWLSIDYWYYITWTNGYRQIQTIRLPDGSDVELGANSSLQYARFGFGRGTRNIWLTGEAQFRVTHQPDNQRFRVHTPDQTVIEVLGTVFVVNSRRNTTRVMLKTGQVRMTTPVATGSCLLSPGDLVTVSKEKKLQKQRFNPESARVTWHDHQFIFHDTPLSELITQLHDTFNVNIVVPHPELRNRRLSGTFEAETADELVQALGLMMNLKVEYSPGSFTLTQPIQ